MIKTLPDGLLPEVFFYACKFLYLEGNKEFIKAVR